MAAKVHFYWIVLLAICDISLFLPDPEETEKERISNQERQYDQTRQRTASSLRTIHSAPLSTPHLDQRLSISSAGTLQRSKHGKRQGWSIRLPINTTITPRQRFGLGIMARIWSHRCHSDSPRVLFLSLLLRSTDFLDVLREEQYCQRIRRPEMCEYERSH